DCAACSQPCCVGRSTTAARQWRLDCCSWLPAASSERVSGANFCRRWRKATSGFEPPCLRPYRSWRAFPSHIKSNTLSFTVITAVSQYDGSDNRSVAAGLFNAEFIVSIKHCDEWDKGWTKEKVIDELQIEFSREFLGVAFTFLQYIQNNAEEGLSGVKGANSV